MTWEAKLAACKSVRTITGLAEVAKFLAAREDAVTLGAAQDGGFKVQKLVAGDSKIALPPPEQIAELARNAGIDFQPGMEERVQPFWASDERVDRDGDIIRQNWELADFLKNPIILFGHQWFAAPIGVSLITEVRDRLDEDFQGRALFMLPMFATAEQSEEADRVFRLVKAGFLKTGSVGFSPIEILIIDDAEERAQLGLGRWGVIFNRSKLIEFSMVSVPANPGAHTLSAVKALKATDVAALRELRRQEYVAGSKSLYEYAIADERLAKALAQAFAFEPHQDLAKRVSIESVARVERAVEPEYPIVTIDEDPDWVQNRDDWKALVIANPTIGVHMDGAKAHHKIRNGRVQTHEAGLVVAMNSALGRRGAGIAHRRDTAIAHLARHFAEIGRDTPTGTASDTMTLEARITLWEKWAETGTLEEFHAWMEERGLGAVLSALAQKAFPNEHACRVREPGDFEEDSFRRITRETDDGKEFAVIVGRLEGEETTTAQSFRYPTSDWTESEARDACESANGIKFEPAEDDDEEEEDLHDDEDDDDEETEGAHDDDDEDDDDEDDDKALAALVAAEIARQLAPLKSQLQSLNVTMGDVRRLLEEQADQIEPTTTDHGEDPAPADAATQAYGLIMDLELEPADAEE